MSDARGPVGHDLPEYEPNWPYVKVKAKVFKGNVLWFWAHDCPRKLGWTLTRYAHPTHAAAFAAALKHARGCW